MPAIAAITLLNGEPTPVSHIFNPLGLDAKTGIWWFEDASPRVAAGSAIGYPRMVFAPSGKWKSSQVSRHVTPCHALR